MVLQSGSGPLPVLVTVAALALFLSATAHLAARNVLGDVDPKRALYVGPLPATIAVVGGALELPAALTVPTALVVDWLVIRWRYAVSSRSAAAITAIHFAVSVLFTVILFGVAMLIASRPG